VATCTTPAPAAAAQGTTTAACASRGAAGQRLYTPAATGGPGSMAGMGRGALQGQLDCAGLSYWALAWTGRARSQELSMEPPREGEYNSMWPLALVVRPSVTAVRQNLTGSLHVQFSILWFASSVLVICFAVASTPGCVIWLGQACASCMPLVGRT